MKMLLSLIAFIIATFHSNAQGDTETAKQLKLLLQKTANFSIVGMVDVKDYSEIRIETSPCAMHYSYKLDWEDEEGETGSKKFITQVKWADVTKVYKDYNPNPYYITIVAEKKEFPTVILENGVQKATTPPSNNIYRCIV